MTSRTGYLMVFASLALGACAAPTPPTTSWDMPKVPMEDYPRLTRAESKANPPHPWVAYEDYMMEPTRFVFHPRNVQTDETDNNGDNEGNEDVANEDFGGGMGGGF